FNHWSGGNQQAISCDLSKQRSAERRCAHLLEKISPIGCRHGANWTILKHVSANVSQGALCVRDCFLSRASLPRSVFKHRHHPTSPRLGTKRCECCRTSFASIPATATKPRWLNM